MAMKQQTIPEDEVAAWNSKVKIGDTVEYRGYPEAEPQVFTTRTSAEVLSGHTAVVWLNGKRGCVCVSTCRITNELPGKVLQTVDLPLQG